MSFMKITEMINGIPEQITVWKEPDGHMFFNPYFESKKCRIFIVTNLFHNYLWLKNNLKNIKDTDYFFIIHTWYNDNRLAKLNSGIVKTLRLNPDHFIFLCNDYKELQHHLHHGFSESLVLNHNAWIDENRFKIIPTKKIYDAILISRAIKTKRIHLANKVKNLAFLTGSKTYEVPLPPHINEVLTVSNDKVSEIINQAKCGLCLSDLEGSCYSSSEYILSGVPVVSTSSLGGRDLWYTEENSIICKDNEESVQESVKKISERKINPELIRNKHIELSKFFRKEFINKTKEIFKKNNENTDSSEYFSSKYYNKMWTFIPCEKASSYLK